MNESPPWSGPLERHIDACRDCYALVTAYAQAYLSRGTGEVEDASDAAT